MVKILGVMGSPRIGGNTDVLMDRALAGAKDAGADVEKIVLDRLDINPCRDCEGCEADGQCAQADDMIPLYDKILQADGLILGTPIYWWGPTAQMKAFIDRWYALVHEPANVQRLRDKKVVLLFAFGDSDASVAEPTNQMFNLAMKYLSVPIVGRVFASAWKRGDIYRLTDKLAQAYQLGQTIAASES